MTLCIRCPMVGYCSHLTAQVVTNDELDNPHFLSDFLRYSQNLNLRPSAWRGYLTEIYSNYNGRILNGDSEEFLDMDVFEIEDDILFEPLSVGGAAKQVSIANDAIRQWVDYWLCQSHKPQEKNEMSELTRERLRVVATILKIQNPKEAQFWGLSRKAANDN